jgi:hypothetical protein
MTQWLSIVVLYLAFFAVLLCSRELSVARTVPGSMPEASNMALVGFNDLQGRSAYQPIFSAGPVENGTLKYPPLITYKILRIVLIFCACRFGPNNCSLFCEF